jgi:hypothetical protein
MLRFNNKGIRQELLVTDVDTVMTVNILIQEAFELSDRKIGLVGHFRKPNVFPTGSVMTLYIFKEQSDVHKDIQMV